MQFSGEHIGGLFIFSGTPGTRGRRQSCANSRHRYRFQTGEEKGQKKWNKEHGFTTQKLFISSSLYRAPVALSHWPLLTLERVIKGSAAVSWHEITFTSPRYDLA